MLADNAVHLCDILDVRQGEVRLRTSEGHTVICSMNGVQSGAFKVAKGRYQRASVRLEVTGCVENIYTASLSGVSFDAPVRWWR